jgi:hypothetical protein
MLELRSYIMKKILATQSKTLHLPSCYIMKKILFLTRASKGIGKFLMRRPACVAFYVSKRTLHLPIRFM